MCDEVTGVRGGGHAGEGQGDGSVINYPQKSLCMIIISLPCLIY